jgi:hypothetical protein
MRNCYVHQSEDRLTIPWSLRACDAATKGAKALTATDLHVAVSGRAQLARIIKKLAQDRRREGRA